MSHIAFHPYAVYHATNQLAMLMPDPRDWQTDRDRQYRHVANVYAPRDHVFALTNHSEGLDWTERLQRCLESLSHQPWKQGDETRASTPCSHPGYELAQAVRR